MPAKAACFWKGAQPSCFKCLVLSACVAVSVNRFPKLCKDLEQSVGMMVPLASNLMGISLVPHSLAET